MLGDGLLGITVVQWLALTAPSAHSKKVLGQGVSVSLWVLSRCCSFLKTCRVGDGLTGHSKFPVGVNVSVDGCLSLYVNPPMNW